MIKIINPKPLSQIRREREEGELPIQLLGQQVALLKIENIQKEQVIEAIGQELVNVKLDLIRLKGGEG